MRLRASAVLLLLAAGSVTAAARAPEAAAPLAIRVVKSPSCGCCSAWVEYLKARGFKVTVEDREEFTALKRANGVTPQLESCHTAFVNGYVVEGHVPAELITKLVESKPAGVKGIAVPGMPVGSPGMEGTPAQRYTVYTFDAKGKATVFAQR